MDYTDRVARGAELLDEQRPGWANEIDVDRLDLLSSGGCVLGQLYGDFANGIGALLFIPGEGVPHATARTLGFIIETAPYGWDMGSRASASQADREEEPNLSAAWRAAIEERRS